MEIGGAGGSLQGRYPLANQADRHARQHVSAAADGHARVAGGIFKDPAAVRNDGPGTFQHQNAAVFFGECLRLPDPVLWKIAREPGKLPGVWRQNGNACPFPQEIYMPGKEIYAVSIENHGLFKLRKDGFQHFPGTAPLSHATADENGIHVFHPLPNFGHGIRSVALSVVRQGEHHRLQQFPGENGIDAPGRPQIHQARPRPQSPHGRQGRRTGIALAAAEQQNFAEIPLMGIPPPGREISAHPL